jgi:hypothetical protein
MREPSHFSTLPGWRGALPADVGAIVYGGLPADAAGTTATTGGSGMRTLASGAQPAAGTL